MDNQKTNHDAIAASKQQWRQSLKEIRQNISHLRRKEASENACSALLKHSQNHSLILSFASFGSEINLWAYNHHLVDEHRLVLPRLIDHQIHLFLVMNIDHLKPHAWGYLEPDPALCLPVKEEKIEIALIPGLGFDLQTKHRLGYGQGYYDKLLKTFDFEKKIGIGFKEQAVENIPSHAHDIPLDLIYLF